MNRLSAARRRVASLRPLFDDTTNIVAEAETAYQREHLLQYLYLV